MKRLLKALGIILLAIIVLIAAAAVWIFIANKSMYIAVDDAEKLSAQKPLDSAEKLSFSKVDESMTILVDKRDIYWYLDERYEEDIFTEIESALEDFGLTLNGSGIHFEDGKLYLDMIVGYKKMEINVSAPCTVKFEDDCLCIKPETIKIFGKEFSIDKLQLDNEELEIKEKITPVLIEKIDDVSVCDEGIKLTGTMSVRYMGMARDGFTPEQDNKMVDDERCSYAAKILSKYAEDPDAGKKMYMEYLENDPGLFPVIYQQLLSMIGSEGFANYHVTGENFGYIYRIIPEFDMQRYFDNYNELAADYK